jgi:hypothetical protein
MTPLHSFDRSFYPLLGLNSSEFELFAELDPMFVNVNKYE